MLPTSSSLSSSSGVARGAAVSVSYSDCNCCVEGSVAASEGASAAAHQQESFACVATALFSGKNAGKECSHPNAASIDGIAVTQTNECDTHATPTTQASSIFHESQSAIECRQCNEADSTQLWLSSAASPYSTLLCISSSLSSLLHDIPTDVLFEVFGFLYLDELAVVLRACRCLSTSHFSYPFASYHAVDFERFIYHISNLRSAYSKYSQSIGHISNLLENDQKCPCETEACQLQSNSQRPFYAENLRQLRIRSFRNVCQLHDLHHWMPHAHSITLTARQTLLPGDLPCTVQDVTFASAMRFALFCSSSLSESVETVVFSHGHFMGNAQPFVGSSLPSSLTSLTLCDSIRQKLSEYVVTPQLLQKLYFRFQISETNSNFEFRNWDLQGIAEDLMQILPNCYDLNCLQLPNLFPWHNIQEALPINLSALHLPHDFHTFLLDLQTKCPAMNELNYPGFTGRINGGPLEQNMLPNSLQTLKLCSFNGPINSNALPNLLEEMNLGNDFNFPLSDELFQALPLLKKLSIGSAYSHPLNTLPAALTTFIFHGTSPLEAHTLPQSLTKLHLLHPDHAFDISVGVLPASLRFIAVGHLQCAAPGIFPHNLKTLEIWRLSDGCQAVDALIGSLNELEALQLPPQALQFPLHPPHSLRWIYLDEIDYAGHVQNLWLPSGLLHVEFGPQFNAPIPDSWFPNTVKTIRFAAGGVFDQPISALPQDLVELQLNEIYSYPLPPLPPSLQRIHFLGWSRYSWPLSLAHCPLLELYLPEWFTQQIGSNVLPKSLKRLAFGLQWNHPLHTDDNHSILPCSLQMLEFGARFNCPIAFGDLPAAVRVLRFGIDFNQPLHAILKLATPEDSVQNNVVKEEVVSLLPRQLRELKFDFEWSGDFNQQILPLTLPESLKVLALSGNFNRSLSDCLPHKLVVLALGRNFTQPLLNISNEGLPQTLQMVRIPRNYPFRQQLEQLSSLSTTADYKKLELNWYDDE